MGWASPPTGRLPRSALGMIAVVFIAADTRSAVLNPLRNSSFADKARLEREPAIIPDSVLYGTTRLRRELLYHSLRSDRY